jgi:hypothetical protein
LTLTLTPGCTYTAANACPYIAQEQLEAKVQSINAARLIRPLAKRKAAQSIDPHIPDGANPGHRYDEVEKTPPMLFFQHSR